MSDATLSVADTVREALAGLDIEAVRGLSLIHI